MPSFDDKFQKDLVKLLQTRRSIRKYKKEVPPRELVQKILEQALWAPSGKNNQNWRFFVVQGDKINEYLKFSQKIWNSIKEVLAQKLKPSLYEFTERFFYTLGEAPIVIFCYAHKTPNERVMSSIGSVFMAIENLILLAHASGLGTCPMGAPLEIKTEIDEFLGLSQEVTKLEGDLELVCAVTLGYPDHEPPTVPRQMQDRICWIDK